MSTYVIMAADHDQFHEVNNFKKHHTLLLSKLRSNLIQIFRTGGGRLTHSSR